MQPFATELTALLKQHRADIIETGQKILLNNPFSAFSFPVEALPSVTAQTVDGVFAVIEEAVHERPPEAMQLFLDSVIPAVVNDEAEFISLAYATTGFSHMLSRVIGESLPEAHRRPALEWLQQFWSTYFARLAQTSLQTIQRSATKGAA